MYRARVPPHIWKFLENIQKEEFLKVRCEGLKEGKFKIAGQKKCDLQRSLQISNAINKYLKCYATQKSYDDLILLMEECTWSVQNFLE